MNENFYQDKNTGFLYWVGGRRTGLRAGSITKDGYRRVHVAGKTYPEHHIAWFMAHGAWPSGAVDHINGDRCDNRPENLREANPLEQMRNRRTPSNNTSGFHGVTKHKKSGRWQAGIGVNGRHVHLGLFDDLLDAAAARHEAERTYGFHENHGRFQP